MIQSALTIADKVLVLFLLIGVGYACAKFGVITKRGVRQMTTLLLYIVTPCVIIASFQTDKSEVSVGSLAVSAGVSVLTMTASVIFSYLFFRKEPPQRRKVMRFGAIYSNSGFMGLPLVQAMLGTKGVMYASIYITVFNIIVWTHGYVMMSGGGKITVKKLFLNPGSIGLIIGLPLYLFSLRLPEAAGTAVHSLADLNTPLAMIVIGGHIASVHFKDLFTDTGAYKAAGARLLLMPALSMLLLWIVKPEFTIFTACLIQASAPIAANTVLFSTEFGGDSVLASKAVSISTLLSIITMPIFTVLAGVITGHTF